MSTWAIIPARGGSRGIPRKNLQLLAGKPLVAHTIEQARAATTIDHVLVNSEDAQIREVAQRWGAEIMDRPDEYAHDTTVQEVDRLLIWTVNELERRGSHIDVLVLLYPTAPLRQPDTIDQAVALVLENGYDSVLSLFEDTTYLWRREQDVVRPVNYDPRTRGPRQQEDWNQWGENKAIYAMKRDLLMNTGCRLGGRIGAVEMPKWQSIDIDRPEDLALCEALLSSGSGHVGPSDSSTIA